MINKNIKIQKNKYLCERFSISPNLSGNITVDDNLSIRYSPKDNIQNYSKALSDAHKYVHQWFNSDILVPIELWIASTINDFQYMVGMKCDEGFFCAPGMKEKSGIIIFQSNSLWEESGNFQRLMSLLAHEIAHHYVQQLSNATVFTMKRKETRDLPMWVEEGICQVIQGEIYKPYLDKLHEKVTSNNQLYRKEEMWDDLSSCTNVSDAYFQSYFDTLEYIKFRGKNSALNLIHGNKEKLIEWDSIVYNYPLLYKDNLQQPSEIILNDELRIVIAKENNWSVAYSWYQNPKVIYYSEGRDEDLYDEKFVRKIYSMMSKKGELYFIEIKEDNKWKAIGDIALLIDETAIIIGEEKYWGKGIASLVIPAIIARAKEIGIGKLYASIYKYNKRSIKLFTKFGYEKYREDEGSYYFELSL